MSNHKKDNWFSWGILILWGFLAWPIAIIYLIIKSQERDKGGQRK